MKEKKIRKIVLAYSGGPDTSVMLRWLKERYDCASTANVRDSLGVKFAESIYYGFWFAPEFELMRKVIDEMQREK